jgi:hypothetical protein
MIEKYSKNKKLCNIYYTHFINMYVLLLAPKIAPSLYDEFVSCGCGIIMYVYWSSNLATFEAIFKNIHKFICSIQLEA